MWNDYEYQVMKRYKKGALLSDEDRYTVYRMASMGFVHRGFTTETGEMQETARLTSLGLRQLRSESVDRSPARRLLCSFLSAMSA